jgi:hypothetical protein
MCYGCCGCPLEGRWKAQQYDPVLPAQSGLAAGVILGNVHIPDHPVFNGVITFKGSAKGSTVYSPGVLNPQATLIASWSNNKPLIAEMKKFVGMERDYRH